ncbi:MAG: hypothetical protein EKK64_03705 [Neisseriaceae bacterium]|nr:MAG: hypothetical protein EKK64_03705 [Neisseriaceae bacterium]
MLDKITVIVLIGNSDNKLTQKEWHYYASDVRTIIWIFEKETHFIGSTEPFSEYQSGCFVFVIEKEQLEELKNRLTLCKQRHNQNFIAMIVGNTQFI